MQLSIMLGSSSGLLNVNLEFVRIMKIFFQTASKT